MIRASALLTLALAVNSASACEALLTSSLKTLDAARVQFSNGARRGLNRQRLDEARFREFIAANSVFAIPRGPSRFETVVFEPNPAHADRAYMVYGRSQDGVLILDSIERAQHFEETDYFKAVATLHGLRARTVGLHRILHNCHSVVVMGWVQTKLWLKHRLPLDSVIGLLDGASPVTYEGRGRHQRYQLTGTSQDGRRLKAVIEEDGPCPSGLITAFEVGYASAR